MTQSPLALLLDRTARRYGARPSTLLGVQDQALALDLDCALTLRAEAEVDAAVEAASEMDDGGFFALVVTLLRLLN